MSQAVLDADAIILGAPGRQGGMCGEMRLFLDTWASHQTQQQMGFGALKVRFLLQHCSSFHCGLVVCHNIDTSFFVASCVCNNILLFLAWLPTVSVTTLMLFGHAANVGSSVCHNIGFCSLIANNVYCNISLSPIIAHKGTDSLLRVAQGKVGSAFTSVGGHGRGFGGHEAILQSFHATFLQHGMVSCIA